MFENEQEYCFKGCITLFVYRFVVTQNRYNLVDGVLIIYKLRNEKNVVHPFQIKANNPPLRLNSVQKHIGYCF